MIKEKCDRCGKDLNGHSIMSMFNRDILCNDCKDEERNHPDYKKAQDADHAAIQKGNYNFDGIFKDGYQPYVVELDLNGRKEIVTSEFNGCGYVAITIPEGVEHIGSYAFVNSNRLEQVNLPASLKTIGDYVFKGCTNLKKINLQPNLVVGKGCFEGCPEIN